LAPPHLRSCLTTGAALAVALVANEARATDLLTVAQKPIELDVTETTVVAQHFDARSVQSPAGTTAPGIVNVEDSRWGEWINRVNASLRWGSWSAGVRLDSALYWLRPVDSSAYSQYASSIRGDNESRFQNSIYPAKMWATYTGRSFELTAGDSYVQFGRGLTLSMRKVDELGIDTTVRGAKLRVTNDPFAATLVAGFVNPSRVDEATGRTLFVTSNLVGSDQATPVFGSDRVIGLDLEAGRGLPVTFSTHVVRFSRCAPYHYNAQGGVNTDLWSDPSTVMFGTCDQSDTTKWLTSLNTSPRGLDAQDITMVGQTLEVPSLGGHGKLFIEGVGQQRSNIVTTDPNSLDRRYPVGNAIYASLTFDVGKVNSTLELKSNRNFYTVAASVGQAAPEFGIVGYSYLPAAESFNMLDAEGTGDFNACVEGGRLREDVTVSNDLLVYAQGAFAYSLTEQPNGRCDALGRPVLGSPGGNVASFEDVMYDGVAGFEYTFQDHRSHVYASFGARDDTLETGTPQYREQHVEYSIAKFLGGAWSLEVQGRHRRREEQSFNQIVDPVTGKLASAYWNEGENYVALRMAPKWVFTQGFEYTTLNGQPLLYFNGSVFYKFSKSSNVRIFAGEQRAGFRCASGICRFFPAYEGVRAELTLRF
jgi:hypothetical protein